MEETLRTSLAVPLLLLATGCAMECTRWLDVRLVDETASGELDALEPTLHAALTRFHRFGASEGAPLDTLALRDEIRVGGSAVRSGENGEVWVVNGTYTRGARRIEVRADAEDLAHTTRHELCHALESAVPLSREWADDLPPGVTPADLHGDTPYNHGSVREEAFVQACAAPPLPFEEHVLAVNCGVARQPAHIDSAHTLAFPGAQVLPGHEWDPDPAWEPLPAEPGGRRSIVALHDAHVVVYVDGRESEPNYTLEFIDLDSGQVDALLAVPGGARALYTNGRRLVVVEDDQLRTLDGPAWKTLLRPVEPWTPAAVSENELLFTHPTRPAIAAVDLDTGRMTEAWLPEGADPDTSWLEEQAATAWLHAPPHLWERRDGDWVPLREPVGITFGNQVDTRVRAELTDGSAVMLMSVDGHDFLALRRPDGRVAVQQGACEARVDGLGPLLSDGERVIMVSTRGYAEVTP